MQNLFISQLFFLKEALNYLFSILGKENGCSCQCAQISEQNIEYFRYYVLYGVQIILGKNTVFHISFSTFFLTLLCRLVAQQLML